MGAEAWARASRGAKHGHLTVVPGLVTRARAIPCWVATTATHFSQWRQVNPGQPVAAVAYPVDKAGADRVGRKAGRVDCIGRPVARRWWVRGSWRLVSCSTQVRCPLSCDTGSGTARVVRQVVDQQCPRSRHARARARQEHLGLAGCPVLTAHHAQAAEQPLLGEDVLRTRAAIARHCRFRDPARTRAH
jgi:hypothetical protein